MIDYDSDLDEIISSDDFAQTITFSGGSFLGIFDKETGEIDVGGGVPFLMTQPKVMARTSEVTDVSVGTVLTIDSDSYTVKVILPDGTGLTELILEAV